MTMGMYGSRKDYRILACRGCEAVYIQTDEAFSEDADHRQNEFGEWESYIPSKIEHWPSPLKRNRPIWQWDIDMLDTSLGELFSDI